MEISLKVLLSLFRVVDVVICSYQTGPCISSLYVTVGYMIAHGHLAVDAANCQLVLYLFLL